VTPEETLALKVALERAGDAIRREYGPALEVPELRRAFLAAVLGPQFRFRVQPLELPRAPGDPPLMGLVSAAALAAHPTLSLRATDHLRRPGEGAQAVALRRERRRQARRR
jgi:hypothetical protein